EAAAVWLFKTLVDGVLVPRDLRALAPLALAYLGLTVAGGAVGFVSGYLSTAISERFLLRLRTGLFAHVQRLPLDFLDRRRLGVDRFRAGAGAVRAAGGPAGDRRDAGRARRRNLGAEAGPPHARRAAHFRHLPGKALPAGARAGLVLHRRIHGGGQRGARA